MFGSNFVMGKKMNFKRICCLILSLALITAVFASCSKTKEEDKTTQPLETQDVSSAEKTEKADETKSDKTDKKSNETEADDMNHPKVLVTMKEGGKFTIELYPEYAPKTVENFLKLVNDGFYNGLTFHRVYAGFMAQGGDPEGTGMGGSKDKIYGEFPANGFSQNTLSHTRGVVSMARSQENNSASSQFFICYSDGCKQLDGEYAAFGKVIEGMDVVDSFCDREMQYNSFGEKASPVEPIYIDTMVQL